MSFRTDSDVTPAHFIADRNVTAVSASPRQGFDHAGLLFTRRDTGAKSVRPIGDRLTIPTAR